MQMSMSIRVYVGGSMKRLSGGSGDGLLHRIWRMSRISEVLDNLNTGQFIIYA